MSLEEDIDQGAQALELILSRLDHVRKLSTPGWSARCPAHHDRHPSLSIGVGKEGRVLLKCHAGCQVEAIVEALGLTMADLFPAHAPSQARTPRLGITVLDLAQDKGLPWQLLVNADVWDEPNGSVRITYHLPDGTRAPRYRIRTALVAREGSLWNRGEGEIVPYGLERLEAARQLGQLVLVEGESDVWTLAFHKIPALGIPGAEMVKTLKPDSLEGIGHLAIIQEPDAAGTAFVKHIAALLKSWQWPRRAYALSLPDAKDANDLHKRDWRAFPAAFQQAFEQGTLIWQGATTASHEETPPASSSSAVPISLPALLARSFSASCWVVRDLLPVGLTLLAGKPKHGKSWLALSVALAIASGDRVFYAYPVERGAVLYLALEDTERRLQERVKQLLATRPLSHTQQESPPSIEFALTWPRLEQGGLAQLEAYIAARPRLRAVVIDTWALVAPYPKGGTRPQYEGDYAALTPLKRLAEAHQLAIMLVHHLRKAGAPDVIDEITGSTGLVGAVDAILVLKRERGQEQGSLFVTGRDIQEERFLPLRFDAPCGRWLLEPTREDEEEQGATSRPASAPMREREETR